MVKESVGKSNFDEIYEEYRSVAMKFALSYTHNYDLAEDVLQDVFMSYYICIQFKGLICEDSLSWIKTAIKNKACNYLRKVRCEDLRDSGVEIIEDQCLSDGPEAVYLEEYQSEELVCFANKILDELWKKNRQWYDLMTDTYVKGDSRIDIAKSKGIPLEALYSMAYRAKNWLRSRYENEYNTIKIK